MTALKYETTLFPIIFFFKEIVRSSLVIAMQRFDFKNSFIAIQLFLVMILNLYLTSDRKSDFVVALLQREHWMPIFDKVVRFIRVFLKWSCKITPFLPCQNSSVHSDSFRFISLYKLMSTAHHAPLFCGSDHP